MLTLQGQDAVSRSEAIASDDRRSLVIPKHHLVIPGVESIEVAIQPSPFRNRTESRLTQATDFAQGVRQILAQETVDLKVATGEQQVFRR